MHRTTTLNLHACSSFHCHEHDCDYCPNCSHAHYRGTTKIDGREYEWEFSPYHGPLFSCRALGKKDWYPHARHEVWKRFNRWYGRYFKSGKGGQP